MPEHIKAMLHAAGETRSITWAQAQEIGRNVEELEAHYREAIVDARTSLRVGAYDTALDILEQSLKNRPRGQTCDGLANSMRPFAIWRPIFPVVPACGCDLPSPPPSVLLMPPGWRTRRRWRRSTSA